MIWIATTIVALLAISTAFQWSIHRRYTYWLATCDLGDDLAPSPLRVAVILCLRGADEELNQCLDRLALLDYPDYEIHTVIDSQEDSSAQVVLQWKDAHQEIALFVHLLN